MRQDHTAHADGRLGVRSALAIALGVALLFPAAAWAADTFSDVPTSHPFHEEIGDVADAGISAGYSDGTFRPSGGVTRQAMAAFLERGVSHVTSNHSPAAIVLGDSDGEVEVLSLQVEVPGEPGGEQLVHLSASAQLFTNESKANTCANADDLCNINLDLRHDSGRAVGPGAFVRIAGDLDGGTTTATGVDVVPSGTTQTYRLVAHTLEVEGSSAIVDEPAVTAITAPMDADAP